MREFYQVVVLHTDQPDKERVVIQDHVSQAEARRIAKLFCGKGFNMDRRTDLHTFGTIGVKIERMKGV